MEPRVHAQGLQPTPGTKSQEPDLHLSQCSPKVKVGHTQRPVSGSQTWPGRTHESQTENEKFMEIMSKCVKDVTAFTYWLIKSNYIKFHIIQ